MSSTLITDYRARLFLPVSFTQNGKSHMGQMQIDSGASHTVFDRSALSQLTNITITAMDSPVAISGIDSARVLVTGQILLNNLSFGEASVQNQSFYVAEILPEPELLGIIGNDILSQFEVTINGRKGTITFRALD